MTRQTNANRIIAIRLGALLFAAVSLSWLLPAPPAFALSELKTIPGQAAPESAPENPADLDAPGDDAPMEIPLPDPFVNKALNDGDGDGGNDDGGNDGNNGPVEPQPPVEVLTDVSKIPQAVARMRELIVEAAASGDIERLRPLLGKGETQTQVSITEGEDDPLVTLKGLSGDGEGVEILAILLDLLSTGFVEADKGTPEAIYVWPYFAEKPLASLTAPEKVDLFRLVTAGDFAEMQEFGSYNFYRVGITADGQWKFFVAGD
ncbi:hypothetical protein [Pararhizobium antarcticum]|uniref:Fibronectin attachment protein n=1 Tax=Pararhizobium antarcticum TaxID=1798805 RepID=A0A657LSN7_9HYPH|nr:hypothetical protein [Pararhizobium antarcticum]OJF92888.1 hypothetical protein AX760_21915 [Pararhizobium antarcticum]OJF97731.1 hypothetical protein AX761_14150 [Rhizobium sp. 58]